MNSKSLHSVINKKKAELAKLVAQKKSLQDQEVYLKSCELDLLVVDYMRLQGKKNPITKMSVPVIN
ncbi:MAG: aspartyl-phosphate phosphatase Spo0E family protein [Clostridia bacterium]|jgi:hypothetical protein|nr:aspartyl-phosphate phosphatase Spo0E family protein [Clostridia bacterium]